MTETMVTMTVAASMGGYSLFKRGPSPAGRGVGRESEEGIRGEPAGREQLNSMGLSAITVTREAAGGFVRVGG